MANDFNYKKNNSDDKFYAYQGKIYLTSKDEKTQSLYNKILSVFDENHNRYLDSNEIQTLWSQIYHYDNTFTDENSDGIMSKEEVQKLINKNPIFKNMKITAEELINFLKIIDTTITKSFAKSFANTSSNLQNKLKAKYPQDKYDIISVSENIIEIYDKKNNKIFMTCNIYGNGSYSFIYQKDNQPVKTEKYNSQGVMESYSESVNIGDYIGWVDGDPISDAIYKDVSSKNKLGLPTTGKDLEKHIKQITPNNIMTVLQNYKNRYNESLLDAIESEWGLDDKVKERIKNYLNKCLIQSNWWKSNKPNTKLDSDFSQGPTGDCWFLASISAIKRSPKGQEILNKTIKDNGNGTYTVKFKGTDKEYTVSALEIMSKEDYAYGDRDVRILEIAANKHYLTGINGGYPFSALELLLGTGDKWKNFVRVFSPKPSKEKIAELLKKPNMVITTSINPYSKLFGIVMKHVDDGEEYKNEIATAHAYAIVGIDDNNIYLINPWYTNKRIAIPLDVFDDYWGEVQYTEIQ